MEVCGLQLHNSRLRRKPWDCSALCVKGWQDDSIPPSLFLSVGMQHTPQEEAVAAELTGPPLY